MHTRLPDELRLIAMIASRLSKLLIGTGLLLCIGLVLIRSASPTREPASLRRESTAHSQRLHRTARLHPATTQSIGGRVRSDAGRELTRARVCAVCSTCSISSAPAGHCSLSTEGGAYEIEEVPEGSFFVSASLPGHEIGQANQGEAVVVDAGARLEGVDLSLRQGRPTLTGQVIDATGGPIGGARVQLALPGYSVRPSVELTTDEAGRFSASMPGRRRIVIRAGASGYASALLFRVLPSTDATLVLTPESTIEGQVVDAATGDPVGGVDVRAIGTMAASLTSPVTSDAQGRFVLSGLEAGSYRLAAEGDHVTGTAPDAPRLLTLGLAERISEVVIPVRRSSSLSGRVLIGDSEEPCTQGFVALGPLNELSLLYRLGKRPEVSPPNRNLRTVRAEMDGRGRVRLRGLVPGHYFVTLDCKGHVYRDGPLELDIDGEDRAATWRIEPGLGLEVVVHDEQGRAVPEANIALEYPTTPTGRRVFMPVRIDDHGRASLAGSLYPGRYVLHPDETLGVEPREVNLATGVGTVTIDFTVPGSGALRVRVQTPRGEPLDRVGVRARGTASSDGSRLVRDGVSAGAGEFVIRPLPAGEYTVEVDDGVNPLWLAEGPRGSAIVLEAGEEMIATAVLNCDAELSGVVMDDAGSPVGDTWVTASLEGNNGGLDRPLGAIEPPRVLSGADGSFSLRGLCGDQIYRLHASRHDGVVGQRASARPGSSVELTLEPVREDALVPDHGKAR